MKNQMNNIKIDFINTCKVRDKNFGLTFRLSRNPIDIKQLWRNSKITSSFGQKSDGKECEGYLPHINNLKLFGRYFGPCEK